MSLHQLYRHFDKAGCLLYVGRSISAICRLVSHAQSEWAPLIAFVEIERFRSSEELARAEARAIYSERPIYNKAIPSFLQSRSSLAVGATTDLARVGKSALDSLPKVSAAEQRASKLKRGRPKLTEPRPWDLTDPPMSRRTYYRRLKRERAEKKAK